MTSITLSIRTVGCLHRSVVVFFRHGEHKGAGDDVLLSALADAIGVYYNATGAVECFSPASGANNASSVDAENWNWQVGGKGELCPPSALRFMDSTMQAYMVGTICRVRRQGSVGMGG